MKDRDSRYQFGQTRWSLVRAAGQKDAAAAAARNELLVRYHEVVNRYLLARLNDPDAADEVYSDFAKRVLEGDSFLERADPTKGKFRHYLRKVLGNMVIDCHRKKQQENRGRRPLVPGGRDEPVAPPDEPADEATFRRIWVEGLMTRAWKALAEAAGGPPYYSVLLYKVQKPAARSQEIAEHFTAKLGRPFTPDGIRQIIKRGQERLADLLVREVAWECAGGAELPPADRVQEELVDLELLDDDRRDALERYRRG